MLDRSVCISCGTAKWGANYAALHERGIKVSWMCPALPLWKQEVEHLTVTSAIPKGCTHLLEQGVAASLRGEGKHA